MNKCFADKGTYCSALKQKSCENCEFYKSDKQYAGDRLKYFELEKDYCGYGKSESHKLRLRFIKKLRGQD